MPASFTSISRPHVGDRNYPKLARDVSGSGAFAKAVRRVSAFSGARLRKFCEHLLNMSPQPDVAGR
jgi:hypothetical protein